MDTIRESNIPTCNVCEVNWSGDVCITIRGGKNVRRFEPLFIFYTFETKFLPSKVRCHTHFNVCACALVQSKRVVNNVSMFDEVEAGLLAAFVLFLSPAMLNLARNSDRNKTSTRYKAIIQFGRLSVTNQGKSNIDKKTHVNLRKFVCFC